MSGKLLKPLVIVATATAIGSSFGFYVWKENQRPPILEIYVFALSSGRSMFIRTPEDYRLLIDGGSNGEVIRELTKILPFYSRRIDALLATNTEGRNLGGLIEVVNRYKIGLAYLPEYTTQSLGLATSTDEINQILLTTLEKGNIPMKLLQAGDRLSLDSKTTLNILFPALAQDFAYSKASPPEILFKVAFGQTSAIFLGNATNKVQKYIVGQNLATSGSHLNFESDVLIVTHSAIVGNLNANLMSEISPDYLIYSKTTRSSGSSIAKVTDSASTKENLKKTTSKDKTSGRPKKIPVDPLASLSDSARFNLKEKGSVKTVSDGQTLSIEPFK
ncbi:MAG: hypothetical protein WCT02_00680 [Candidatus Paceibacterota bacterium]|jgi:beta-lactamase superfamily II metal-dependent hydrolase